MSLDFIIAPVIFLSPAIFFRLIILLMRVAVAWFKAVPLLKHYIALKQYRKVQILSLSNRYYSYGYPRS